MNILENEKLGNFGYLLDKKQPLLFELAQLAESNVYTNSRLCAVYIRQITENFFDFVIDHFHVQVQNNGGYEPTIVEKQKALCWHFNNRYARTPDYGKKAFPAWPGNLGDSHTRPACPEGEGDEKRYKDGDLIDPQKKTLYVWTFIRRLGNIGSHVLLTEDNRRWLQPEYLIEALNQLCGRMADIFFGIEGKRNQVTFSVDRFPLSNRQIYFSTGKSPRMIKGNGILPTYVESTGISIMPQRSENDCSIWLNYVNRYAIIRRFKKMDGLDDYLLHSQAAYMQMRQSLSIAGLADFSVLVDLRNSCDYYITAYEFDSEPHSLDKYTLAGFGISGNPSNLKNLFSQIAMCLQSMENTHVYHRNLSHESIKLCKQSDGTFLIKIIDLELCKLFSLGIEEDNIPAPTVFAHYNEFIKVVQQQAAQGGAFVENYDKALRQYVPSSGISSAYSDDTPEETYAAESIRRLGCVYLNIMCPLHLEPDASFEKCATADEILSSNQQLKVDPRFAALVELAQDMTKENVDRRTTKTMRDVLQKLNAIE